MFELKAYSLEELMEEYLEEYGVDGLTKKIVDSGLHSGEGTVPFYTKKDKPKSKDEHLALALSYSLNFILSRIRTLSKPWTPDKEYPFGELLFFGRFGRKELFWSAQFSAKDFREVNERNRALLKERKADFAISVAEGTRTLHSGKMTGAHTLMERKDKPEFFQSLFYPLILKNDEITFGQKEEVRIFTHGDEREHFERRESVYF
jgi:hypothetical protein